jgi:RimJ/RimL family protein N-acetyltransferase
VSTARRADVLPDVVIDVADRVQLTVFSASDAPAITAAVADDEIRRWLPLPRPYPVALAEQWITETTESIRTAGTGLVRCIRVGGVPVGCVDAKRIDWRSRTIEIGYWLAPGHRGRGLASAAVGSLARWLVVEQAFERVELRIATANRASTAVAARAGFTFEGTARNAGFIDTCRVDLGIWSLVADDIRAERRAPD